MWLGQNVMVVPGGYIGSGCKTPNNVSIYVGVELEFYEDGKGCCEAYGNRSQLVDEQVELLT